MLLKFSVKFNFSVKYFNLKNNLKYNKIIYKKKLKWK